VRTGRDADNAVADVADLLAGLDVVADVHVVRPSVPVVDAHALERTRGDLEDRSIGAEAADPGADDDAVAHRV
jgi:hypothetical protein